MSTVLYCVYCTLLYIIDFRLFGMTGFFLQKRNICNPYKKDIMVSWIVERVRLFGSEELFFGKHGLFPCKNHNQRMIEETSSETI